MDMTMLLLVIHILWWSLHLKTFLPNWTCKYQKYAQFVNVSTTKSLMLDMEQNIYIYIKPSKWLNGKKQGNLNSSNLPDVYMTRIINGIDKILYHPYIQRCCLQSPLIWYEPCELIYPFNKSIVNVLSGESRKALRSRKLSMLFWFILKGYKL